MMTTALKTLCRQRQVEAIHRLGARVALEFVGELARRHPEIAADLDWRLARYAEINPVALAVTDGDQMPPHPFWAVGR